MYTAAYTMAISLIVLIPVLSAVVPGTAAEIHKAVSAGDLSEVESILADDPGQVKARDETLRTPLHVAVADSQVAIARLLIAKGADVNTGDGDNAAPLHWAAIEGKRELVEILLAAGADLEAEEDYGNSPLDYAIYGGQAELTNLLLDRGADTDHVNTQGQTPLQYAVAGGHTEIVRLLVANGADVDHVDAYGLTPLFSARTKGLDGIVSYLEEAGATRDFEIGRAKIEKLVPGFHVVTVPLSNRTNCGVLSGEEGVLLVDTGYQASAPRILEALAEIAQDQRNGSPTVLRIITTHLHGDHFAAHRFVDSSASVIDFTNLEQMAADGMLTKSEVGVKGRTGKSFGPSYAMRFGGEEIILIPAPGTHSDTDMIVWFKRSGVVCTGSLLLSEAFPGVSAGKIDRYVEILDTMIDVFPDDTVFMPGHGHPVDMAGLEAYANMVKASVRAVRKAVARGESVDDMLAENILAPWAEYGECSFLPYLTRRLWVSAVARSYTK